MCIKRNEKWKPTANTCISSLLSLATCIYKYGCFPPHTNDHGMLPHSSSHSFVVCTSLKKKKNQRLECCQIYEYIYSCVYTCMHMHVVPPEGKKQTTLGPCWNPSLTQNNLRPAGILFLSQKWCITVQDWFGRADPLVMRDPSRRCYQVHTFSRFKWFCSLVFRHNLRVFFWLCIHILYIMY